jgi:glycerol-3-phosphate dehydrogenase
MKRDINNLARETFDLVVIGGGIIGTGIARDASFRGIKTLLLEKEDFSYGTTSRSSRLIHGGLRYLRHFDFGLVRQDMREREVLLKIAPHLVHPLPFILPITKPWDRLVMALGMRLYDILSFDKTLPSYRYLSSRDTLELEPDLELNGLVGSYLFYDCQIPFAERLCIENAISAAEYGASLVNHARVISLVKKGNAVCGLQVEDLQSGEVYQVMARLVVNAAGHWMDEVCSMVHSSVKPVVRRTKGIHLVVPRICDHAIVLFAQADGRLFFIIPWQDYALIGTTDTDYRGDLDNIYAEAEDVTYLLREVERVFPTLHMEDILYATAGLRALVGSGGEKASNVSRQHRLIDHERSDGVTGFISLLGGKLTGYRAIAEQAVNLVCQKLGVRMSCETAEVPLPGARATSQGRAEQVTEESGLPAETVAHLIALYGSRFNQILDLVRQDSRGGRPICSHCRDVVAQIWHAVAEESALTIGDFLLRRTVIGLESCQGLDTIETVASEMGRLLGWNSNEQKQQVEMYRTSTALGRKCMEGLPVHKG